MHHSYAVGRLLSQFVAFGMFLVAYLIGGPTLAAPVPISAVASIAEMQRLQEQANPMIQVLSYYANINKGGGLFAWKAASTAAPDDCVIFAPNPVAAQKAGLKGRWIRQLSGALD